MPIITGWRRGDCAEQRPKLQRLLLPFYEKRGMVACGYGSLLWRYLVLNRKAHTKWEGEAGTDAVAQAAS